MFLITFFLVRKLTDSYTFAAIVSAVKSILFLFVAQAAVQDSFTGDSLRYWIRSARFDEIFLYWQTFIFEPEQAWGGGHWGYYLVNWVSRKMFFDSPMGPIFFNSVVGLISGYLVFLVAKELTANRRFSVLAGTIFIVTPESLVWTSYNVKDSWVQMLTLSFLLMAFKAFNGIRISTVGMYTLFAVASAISIWPFRYYVPSFMLVCFGLWTIISIGLPIRSGYARRLIGLAVFSIGAVWMASYGGLCPSISGIRCNGDADLIAAVRAIVTDNAKEKPGDTLNIQPTALVTDPPVLASVLDLTESTRDSVDIQLSESADGSLNASSETKEDVAAESDSVDIQLSESADGSLNASSETKEDVAVESDSVDILSSDLADISPTSQSKVVPIATESVTYTIIEGGISVPDFKGIPAYVWNMLKLSMTPRPWAVYDPYWPQLLPASLINWLLLPWLLVGAVFLVASNRRTAFMYFYMLVIISAMTMFTNLIGPRQRFMLYPITFISQAYGLKILCDYYAQKSRYRFSRCWLKFGQSG